MVETRKQCIILLLLVMLLPSVTAANLEEISMTYNGHPVHTLATGETLDVDITIVIDGEEFADCLPVGGTRCAIALDTSGLYPGGGDLSKDLRECVRNETEHTCSFSTRIKADNESLDYEVRAATSYPVLNEEGSFSIVLDDTVPVLSKLETAFCQDGLCFVGSNAPTTVTATFTDSLTSFDYKLVRFEVGRESGHASTCGANTCTGIVESGYCADGDRVPIKVTNFYGNFPSSEDAMNPVENSREIQAKCDADDPVLTAFDIYSEGTIPSLFETAAPLHMTARLNDMAGGAITVFVNTSGVSETDGLIESPCEEINAGEFFCELQILNLIPGTHELEFVFYDGVSNSITQKETIVVMETYDAGDEIIDFFQTNIDRLTPEVLNRVALDLAAQNNINYPLLVDYTIQRQRGSDVHIVHQSLQNLECYWSGVQQNLTNLSNANNGLFRIDNSYILKPNADYGVPNRMVLNFQEDAGNLPDVVYAKCYYDVYVQEEDRFYSQPEREELSFVSTPIRLKNSVLGEPGAAFVEEIERVENGVDSSFGNALNKINRVAATADEICTIYGMLTQVNLLGAGLESMIPIPVVGEILAGIGDAIYTPTQYVFEFLADGGKGAKAAGSSISKTIMDQRSNNRQYGENLADGVSGLDGLQGGGLDANNFLSQACDWWNCATAEKEKAVTEGICGTINEWWQAPITSNNPPSEPEATAEDVIDTMNTFLASYQTPQETDAYLQSIGVTTRTEVKQAEARIEYMSKSLEPESNPQTPVEIITPPSVASMTGQNLICAPDYSKSILASVGLYGGGLCLRGVLYNLGKWQAIDCGYLVCLKEQALTGQNINICKQAKKYKECAYVFDEISQVPYVNAFTNIFAGINAQVQDAPLEMLYTLSDYYCVPGAGGLIGFARDQMVNMVFQYLNAETGGKLGAMKTLLTLLTKFKALEKLVPILNFAGGSGRPVVTEPQNLVCHIISTVYHTSEFYTLSQSGVTGPSNFEMQYDICEAAKCNPEDVESCDYDASYLGWLGSDTEFYRRMLANSQKSSTLDPALNKLINDALKSGKAIDELMQGEFMEKVKSNFGEGDSFNKKAYNDFKKSLKDYRSDFNKLKKDDKLPSDFNYEKWLDEQGNKYGDTNTLKDAYSTSGFEPLKAEFTIEYDVNGAPSRITKGGSVVYPEGPDACTSNCFSKSDATSLGEATKRNAGSDLKDTSATISGEDVADQALKGGNCAANDGDCGSGSYADQKEKLDDNVGIQEDNLNFPESFSFEDAVRSGAIKDLSTDYNNFMDKEVTADNFNEPYPSCKDGASCESACGQSDGCTYSDVRDFKRLNIEDDIILLCREQGGNNCNAVRLEGQNLVDGNGVVIAEDVVNPKTTGERFKSRMSEEAKTLISTFVVKWLRDSGYLENLRLSGLGSWGAKRAAEAEKTFSPESWKQNLCSGSVDLEVEDSPVWGLTTTDGPVLTFATERREVQESEEDEPYYIYSITYYIRSGNMPDQYGVVQDEAPSGLEDGHKVRFLLKPGNVEYVNCSTNESVTSEGYPIEWGGVFSAISGTECNSWIDTRKFTELCLVFDKKFPDYTGQTMYCREIQEDAFDRGSATEGEVGIFG